MLHSFDKFLSYSNLTENTGSIKFLHSDTRVDLLGLERVLMPENLKINLLLIHGMKSYVLRSISAN